MKRPTEPQRATSTLPAFLEEPTTTDSTTATATDEGTAGDLDTHAAATPEPTTDVADATNGEAAGDPAATESPAARERVDSKARERQAARARHGGGKLAMIVGGAVLLAGLALSVLPDLAQKAANYGVQPNLPFVLGTLLFAAGATQRHIGRMQQRLDEAESRRQFDTNAMQQNLQQLVADSGNKAPAQGEEMQHLMMSLQRQDEKINNLTKAIKMYGKPLMEITGQSTDLAGGMANIKALVEGGIEANRQGLGRLEAQLRAPQNQKEFSELNGSLQKLMARIESLAGQKTTVDMTPLQQQVGRLEVTVAAIAQRLEDNEVRKSLLRLEEQGQKDRDTLQELLRGETVQKATASLQSRVETATKGLADGLTQLRDGNLGGLENAVREIQREVSGVATTVAQINAAVKGGVRVATAAVAAPATPTPATSDSTPTATPAPAPAPAAAATGTGEGGGGYSTGARSTGSKNVLGAIAKLKQMKG